MLAANNFTWPEMELSFNTNTTQVVFWPTLIYAVWNVLDVYALSLSVAKFPLDISRDLNFSNVSAIHPKGHSFVKWMDVLVLRTSTKRLTRQKKTCFLCPKIDGLWNLV